MTLKRKLHIVIFGTDTKLGKRFDVVLLYLILTSVLAVMLESMPELGSNYSTIFLYVELFFTAIFSIEYVLRIWISPKPIKYIFSFWGVVDLISILPSYLILLIPSIHFLSAIRSLRLFRIFRIIKLVRFLSEANSLKRALVSSLYKISTFLFSILAIVVIMGTTMYVVEGAENGFTSIPQSIYWAIITITTVGYGDIVPHTIIGKVISSVVMLIGYAIIAVPTGIFTVEIAKAGTERKKCEICKHDNETNATYCSNCGKLLTDV
ncbi:MAG: ion transporter [Flavobacteriales bacterium CG18_big_fil_WC_8_21_14_2_50_32_9]|nr:MAG: ion transporter [Flavobacteriales bacterium CG18_big_fil_WC_8_21_14_2_50_32_9]